MKLKHLLFAMLLLFCAGLSACGSSGSEGLNGAISVQAEATGSVINATATYTNPTETNLIGVPISFTVRIGSFTQELGTFGTNNSGSVGVAFSPPPFSGSQTVTVIARTGNLTDFESLQMTGRSLLVTAPASLSLTTGAAAGTLSSFTIPSALSFVTVTDPFGNDIAGHPISISASFVSTNPGDNLNAPISTQTGTGGIAPFPGASGTLVTPASVGGVESMNITWTVTDTITGQSGSAITTVTLNKIS